ncbi:hypothetical protein GCM10023088_49660 [Actinomadura verrucosospora]
MGLGAVDRDRLRTNRRLAVHLPEGEAVLVAGVQKGGAAQGPDGDLANRRQTWSGKYAAAG